MKAEESWLALEITVASEASEAVEFALNEIGALGTEINLLGKREPQKTICVIGYFNEKPNADFLQDGLTEALRIYGFPVNSIEQILWREVENNCRPVQNRLSPGRGKLALSASSSYRRFPCNVLLLTP